MLDQDSKMLLFKSSLLIVASKSLAIASPWFLKSVVDSMAIVGSMDFNVAAIGIGLFGASRLFSTILQETRMLQISKFIQHGIRKISFDSFQHLHSLDLNYHKTSSKNTVFAINRALRSIDSGLRFTLGFFTPVAVEFFLLCFMLQFYCGPKYLGNMLFTLGVYTLYTKQVSNFRREEMRQRKDAEKKTEFYLNESIMNYETVKAFNNEQLESNRYQGHLNHLYDSAMTVQRSLNKLNIGQSFLYSAGMTVNLLMAANDVYHGKMTAGDFIMVQAYFMQLSGPLFNMGTMFREVQQTQIDVEELFHMLQLVPKVQESPNATDFNYKGGSVEFRGVSFGHENKIKNAKQKLHNNEDETNFLFQNFDLKIEAGTTNAIVGRSGFGKTTLLHLLFRIYDPENGQVFIDGQDIKDLKLASFRQYVSVIPQNGILFNDTIEFNLRYGNPDASLEEIMQVAKQCQIHEKILEMPDGYNHQVGDLGSKLSGGERQRILIARGLLKKNAKIFLFDEATSSLDSHTEKALTEELDHIMKGKTVIYCAHRLSSIMNVDKIHVVADGKLVEQGRHNELLSSPTSLYSQMWKNYLREAKEKEIPVVQLKE